MISILLLKLINHYFIILIHCLQIILIDNLKKLWFNQVMKRIVIFLVFIMSFNKSFSSPKWKKISTNKNGDAFYVNEKEVSKINDKYNLLVLINSPFGADSSRSGIRSIIIRIECECLDLKYKTKDFSLFTDYMGKGEKKISSKYDIMNFNSPNFWTFVSKGSSEESIIKFVCS